MSWPLVSAVQASDNSFSFPNSQVRRCTGQMDGSSSGKSPADRVTYAVVASLSLIYAGDHRKCVHRHMYHPIPPKYDICLERI